MKSYTNLKLNFQSFNFGFQLGYIRLCGCRCSCSNNYNYSFYTCIYRYFKRFLNMKINTMALTFFSKPKIGHTNTKLGKEYKKVNISSEFIDIYHLLWNLTSVLSRCQQIQILELEYQLSSERPAACYSMLEEQLSLQRVLTSAALSQTEMQLKRKYQQAGFQHFQLFDSELTHLDFLTQNLRLKTMKTKETQVCNIKMTYLNKILYQLTFGQFSGRRGCFTRSNNVCIV